MSRRGCCCACSWLGPVLVTVLFLLFYTALCVCLQLYMCRCLWNFSSEMERPWILPCGASGITTPYTSSPLRRRMKTRAQRQRRFTAVIPDRCPLAWSHKASVFFGCSIRRLWERQRTASRFCQRKVGQKFGGRRTKILANHLRQIWSGAIVARRLSTKSLCNTFPSVVSHFSPQ